MLPKKISFPERVLLRKVKNTVPSFEIYCNRNYIDNNTHLKIRIYYEHIWCEKICFRADKFPQIGKIPRDRSGESQNLFSGLHILRSQSDNWFDHVPAGIYPGRWGDQISEALGIPLRTLQRESSRLKASGQITFHGSPKNGGYFGR